MDTLRKCPLFTGLDEAQTRQALRFFDARERTYPRGDTMNRPGDSLPRFGLLLSGGAQVRMDDIDGRHRIMTTLRPGGTFGEALCYLGREASVYIVATEEARVLWMGCGGLQGTREDDLAREMRRRFTAMLAARTLYMNDRIQALSRTGIREKLIAYFSQCARDAGSAAFTVPLSRADMAAYLGVDRSALSRELSRMHADGWLQYRKNAFRLLREL